VKLPKITRTHSLALRATLWAAATFFATWCAMGEIERGRHIDTALHVALAITYVVMFITDLSAFLLESGKEASHAQGKADASEGMVSPDLHKRLAGHLAILPPLSVAAYSRAMAIAGTATELEDAALYQGILSYLNAAGAFSPNPTQPDDFAVSLAVSPIKPGDLIALRVTDWSAHRAARVHAAHQALDGMLKLYPGCKGVVLGPDIDIETVRAPEVPATLKALQRLVTESREG
jgi:hypothetical protein